MSVYINPSIRGGNNESGIPLCLPFSEGSTNIFDCLKGVKGTEAEPNVILSVASQDELCGKEACPAVLWVQLSGSASLSQVEYEPMSGRFSTVSQSVLNLMRQEFVLGKPGCHFKQIP